MAIPEDFEQQETTFTLQKAISGRRRNTLEDLKIIDVQELSKLAYDQLGE